MKHNKLYFCVHSIDEFNGEKIDESSSHKENTKGNIITFCPIEYWEQYNCLPDYNFSDEMNIIEGYSWYLFSEETQWFSLKSINQIHSDLSSLDYIFNIDMQKFLSDCYK